MGPDLNILCDTHAILWWWNKREYLSDHAAALLADRTNQVFVSAVSAWEIGTKVRSGKLQSAIEIPDAFDRLVNDEGFSHLSLNHAHALRCTEYEQNHRDPFDRMLVAQAEIEGLTFLTKDRELAAFPCRILW